MYSSLQDPTDDIQGALFERIRVYTTTVPPLLSKSKIRDRYEEEKLTGLVVLSDNILAVLPAMIRGRSDVRRRARLHKRANENVLGPRDVSLTTIDL